MIKKMNLLTKVLAIIGGIVLLSIFILTLYSSISARKITTKISLEVMNKEASYEGERVYATFNAVSSRVAGLGRTIEGLLESGEKDPILYKSIVDGYAKRVDRTTVVGIAIAFEKGILNSPDYVSYYAYYDDKAQLVPAESVNDVIYEMDAYKIPMKSNSPYLTPVYKFEYGTLSTELITYSLPIIYNNRIVGIIMVDMRIDIMNNFIKDIFVFDVGELTLLDQGGTVLGLSLHGVNQEDARKKYVGKNIKELGWWQDLDLINNMKNNKVLEIIRINTLNKTKDAYYFLPIKMSPNESWGLMVQVPMEKLTHDADRARTITIIVSIAIVLVLVIVIIKLTKSLIVNPIKYAVEEVEHIAKGDLTKETDPAYMENKDEIGILIHSFDKMKKDIANIVSNINSAATEISSAANEVSEGNKDLSHRTETQAASLEETASSMEEMASTIKSSAEYSVEGNKMMIESKEAVSSAGAIIDTTTKGIEEVLEASTKISDITKMIESIALQTNILALNAAVEAARAGEQGRGFAVVASEVRNLAQTTQTSVKDITTLIADVNDKIKKATESAHESKVIFDDIQKKITNTASIMQDISSTAIEQQSGVDQINKAVTDMDIVTQQNAALVEESTAAAESLSAQARDLVDVISFFKIRDMKEHVSNLFDGNGNSNINKHAKAMIKSPLKDRAEASKINNKGTKQVSNGGEFGSTISKANGSKEEYESF